jgi:hypothetical protein
VQRRRPVKKTHPDQCSSPTQSTERRKNIEAWGISDVEKILIAPIAEQFVIYAHPFYVDVRWNINLDSVTFTDLTLNPPPISPLPAALPLFATGFAGLGLLGWRRKRKASYGLLIANM